jgi:hypothetical protein
MKVYVVGYYDSYDAFNFVGVFSSEDKAETFIEICKKPFYKNKVLYDYRSWQKDLFWEDYDVDDFENVLIK